MAEKLKSISKRIHWSSLLRAAVFGLSWLWLPSWAFIFVALYLYLIPWFRVGALAMPFIVLLILAFSTASGGFMAIIFAAIFYLILLVKDLIVLDRRALYEVIVLGLILLLLRAFYANFNQGATGSALLYAFIVAGAAALLFRNFIAAVSGEATFEKRPQLVRVATWILFLLFVQLFIAGLLLPLDFTYQSTIIFLVVVLLVDLIAEYLFSGLSREKLLGVATVVGTLLVLILSSARFWL